MRWSWQAQQFLDIGDLLDAVYVVDKKKINQ